MKPVRELMKDPKVAGGLAALALAFVVFRVTQMGKRPGGGAVPDNAAAAAAAAPAASDNGTSSVFGASAAADNAATVPKGEVAWNWERNPFIGPPKKVVGPTGAVEEFPKIVVPGFGGKGAAADPLPPAVLPAVPEGDVRPKEAFAEVEEPLPGLRGTVLSGGRAVAIFGSRLVPQGEQVAGWTVDRVTAYDVSLRKGSQRRTIEMFKPGSVEGKGGKP